MNKILSVWLLVLLCIGGCKSPETDKQTGNLSLIVSESVKGRVDSTLKALVDSRKVVGISALIFEKNKEVYFNAFGFADREANKPMERTQLSGSIR